MTERIVYISPYQLGALAALGKVVNLPVLLKSREPINVNAIVYGSMIQCGVEKFEIPKHMKSHYEEMDFAKSKFLKTRISLFSDSKGKKSQEIVKNAFDRFFPENFRKSEEHLNVRQLEQFISDLIFSAERKTSCMTLFPVPKISILENQLPPELMFPIRNLLTSFEPLTPSLPYPKLSVRSADINKFEQIIDSDLFVQYVVQHGKLEMASLPTKPTLDNVVKSGKGVWQRNSELLQLKEMTISVLPVTAKLIDVVFGKLPGALADYSANLLTSLLKDEKRIVVYQLNSIFEDLVKTYVTPFAKNS